MENFTAGEDDVVPIHHRIILSVILIAVTVTGIFGNTLIIIACCLSRRLQTKTNIFVINLTAADFLTCILLPIAALSLLIDVDENSRSWLDTLCTIDLEGIRIFLGCSVMTLAFIAVNRYVLITKSRETYRRIYQRKFIVIFISISWLYQVLSFIPQLAYGVLHFGYDEKLHACNVGTDHDQSPLYGILLIIGILLPIAMMVYSYGRIYLFVRHHNKQMQNVTSSELSR